MFLADSPTPRSDFATGASVSEATKLTGESDKQIKVMQSNYTAKKDEIENMLAGLVTKVNNVPPKARQQAA